MSGSARSRRINSGLSALMAANACLCRSRVTHISEARKRSWSTRLASFKVGGIIFNHEYFQGILFIFLIRPSE